MFYPQIDSEKTPQRLKKFTASLNHTVKMHEEGVKTAGELHNFALLETLYFLALVLNIDIDADEFTIGSIKVSKTNLCTVDES